MRKQLTTIIIALFLLSLVSAQVIEQIPSATSRRTGETTAIQPLDLTGSPEEDPGLFFSIRTYFSFVTFALVDQYDNYKTFYNSGCTLDGAYKVKEDANNFCADKNQGKVSYAHDYPSTPLYCDNQYLYAQTCYYNDDQTPSPSTSGCTDTDGGNKPFTRGTAKDQYGSWTDVCIDYDGDGKKNELEENYCQNNEVYFGPWLCRGACQNGACCQTKDSKKCYNGDVYYYDSCGARGTKYQDCGTGTCSSGQCKSAPTVSCSDSDGQNYFKKGTVTDASGTKTDYCNNNYVVEYICSGSSFAVRTQLCSYGCTDGRCYSESPCQDSDGENYFKKGTVTTPSGSYTDTCSGNSVVENLCSGNSKITKTQLCTFGCTDGRCYSEDPTPNNPPDYRLKNIRVLDDNTVIQSGEEDQYVYVEVIIKNEGGLDWINSNKQYEYIEVGIYADSYARSAGIMALLAPLEPTPCGGAAESTFVHKHKITGLQPGETDSFTSFLKLPNKNTKLSSGQTNWDNSHTVYAGIFPDCGSGTKNQAGETGRGIVWNSINFEINEKIPTSCSPTYSASSDWGPCELKDDGGGEWWREARTLTATNPNFDSASCGIPDTDEEYRACNGGVTGCSDDDAINYFKKGTTTTNTQTKTDYCKNSDSVVEYSCNENEGIDETTQLCTYGCTDGRCYSECTIQPVLVSFPAVDESGNIISGTTLQYIKNGGVKKTINAADVLEAQAGDKFELTWNPKEEDSLGFAQGTFVVPCDEQGTMAGTLKPKTVVDPGFFKEDLRITGLQVRNQNQEVVKSAGFGELLQARVTFENFGTEPVSVENFEVGIYEAAYLLSNGLFSIVTKDLESCGKEEFTNAGTVQTLEPGGRITTELDVRAPTKDAKFKGGDANFDNEGIYYLYAGIYQECGEGAGNKAGRKKQRTTFSILPSLAFTIIPDEPTGSYSGDVAGVTLLLLSEEDDITITCYKCEDGAVQSETITGDTCPSGSSVHKPSSCDSGPECGNGIIEYPERCDGTDFGGESCDSFGSDYGEIDCYSPSSSYACTLDTSGCEDYECGNNDVEPGEQCDGGLPIGVDCSDVGPNMNGTPTCNSGCRVDYGACQGVAVQCSDGTTVGDCSISTNFGKPSFCNDQGTLIPRASYCGCPSGQQALADGTCVSNNYCSSNGDRKCSYGTIYDCENNQWLDSYDCESSECANLLTCEPVDPLVPPQTCEEKDAFPVCGMDGVDYRNPCAAIEAGTYVDVDVEGACSKPIAWEIIAAISASIAVMVGAGRRTRR